MFQALSGALQEQLTRTWTGDCLHFGQPAGEEKNKTGFICDFFN
ncbi:MAG: hypothetical protein AB1523_09400 [Bacillota bacterium]